MHALANTQPYRNLCHKLNSEEDPGRHVHMVWYVIAATQWTEIDEFYCSRVFVRPDGTKMPVLVVVNKVCVCMCVCVLCVSVCLCVCVVCVCVCVLCCVCVCVCVCVMLCVCVCDEFCFCFVFVFSLLILIHFPRPTHSLRINSKQFTITLKVQRVPTATLKVRSSYVIKTCL